MTLKGSDGSSKYPSVSTVIKTCLSISWGCGCWARILQIWLHTSWYKYCLEEAEAKQKKAEEEAATSARRRAQKDLEGQKQLTEKHAKEKLADCLLTEAENKLKKLVQTGDVTDINVAQTLLETAQLKRAERERQLKQQQTYRNGSNARLHYSSRRPIDILVWSGRLVVLESGLGLESGLKSIFAGLGLGL